MAAGQKSDPMEVGSESADGDGQLQRTADRIIRILSQVAECLDEYEMEDMNGIVLDILELSKKRDRDTREELIEYYMGFLEVVEFCSGISVELIKQAIRCFLLIEQDAEGLGKLVSDLYMEMILVEYPSLGIDMNLTPDLLRAYFRLLTEGYEEICHIRLMVVGMYEVGKTTLVRRLCNQSTEDVSSTVGVDIHTNSCEINGDGDWEISTKDEQERFYNERLQELVNKYGKRTHFQNMDSSFSEPERTTVTSTTTSTTTGSTSTATLTDYETEKETFKKKVDENTQQDDGSFFGDLQRVAKEKKIPKRKPTVSIWDFAGQSVYYSTHHFFLNARSTYLVVLDISKQLTDKVKETEKNPILESTTEGYTCHDAFKFWMKSIYIYTEQEKKETARSDFGRVQIPTYKPRIILIGTHKDKLRDDDLKGKTCDEYAEEYFFKALKCFIDTPIMDLVHGKKFVISKDDEAEVFLSIKKEILKIAKGSPIWREKVPANFILLEKAVYDRKNHGEQMMSFKDLEKVNEDSDLPRQAKDDIKTFLAFHNAFGNVMYYQQDYLDQMIILNPQWIINIFKIFIKHKTQKHLKQRDTFEQYGKLEEAYIFELLEENGWSDMKQDIVRCMEYLNVMVRPIALVETEAPETKHMSQGRITTPLFQKDCVDMQPVEDFYIMPCQLQPRPTDEKLEKLFGDCGRYKQPATLCMNIKKGFLPPFVFHCITATILKELPIAMVKGKRLIFRGLAGFQLNSTRILLIWCIDNLLHVTVIFKNHKERDEEKVKCCKDVKRGFKKLVFSAFNFHGKNTFDDDSFEYRVRCPKCPQQVPFHKPMESVSYMNGLLSVKNIEFTKEINCSICDNLITEKEALEYWFDIKPASSVLEEHLKVIPTLDMLADLAEEIGSNEKRLAHELSIDENKYEKIAYYCGISHTNLVFHILYEWKSNNESAKTLLEAMKKSRCSTKNFDRIVRGIETDKTKQQIEDCMKRLDTDKFEKDDHWGRVVNKIVDLIGNEHWIVGIRLGIEEKKMQRLANNHLNDVEGHIRDYLGLWRKEDKGLQHLVKALVKSLSFERVDPIIHAFVDIHKN